MLVAIARLSLLPPCFQDSSEVSGKKQKKLIAVKEKTFTFPSQIACCQTLADCM